MSDFETVIGLECHVELATATKMFCGCPNEFGAPPNTNVCPICLGHPGTLPVPNEKAIEYTIKIGLALDCRILARSLFHRKNYFYPDMPKNYQISQYDVPICIDGHLDIQVDGTSHSVGITRVHLEEDTGKTAHAGATGRIAGADYALEDYNRAGVPLVEVVSEPDMRTPEEARAYLTELRAVLESLGVSDVRMEEGSLRCDTNISLRPAGTEELGTKIEVKNLNSVRSVYRALVYEEQRQRKALEAGERLVQETRHWDENKGITTPGRSKEYASDYRYFPEPDLAPIEPDAEWIEKLRAQLPELPAARRRRFAEKYADDDLQPEQIRTLADSKELSDLFDVAVSRLPTVHPRMIANFVTQEIAARINDGRLPLSEVKEKVQAIVDSVELAVSGEVSWLRGRDALDEAVATGKSVREIVEEKGWRQVSDASALETVVDEVIAENAGPAEQYRNGKEGAINALVGQVMKKTKGAANPGVAAELLRKRLSV